MNNSYSAHKRSYHPFLLVLFHLGILDQTARVQIPCSTLSYWKRQKQRQQTLFGYEFVRDYMEQHEDIRAVFTSKQLYRFVRFSCRMHEAYTNLLELKAKGKVLVRDFHKVVVESIDQLSRTVPRKVAARLMNTTCQSYYRFRNNLACGKSRIKLVSVRCRSNCHCVKFWQLIMQYRCRRILERPKQPFFIA